MVDVLVNTKVQRECAAIEKENMIRLQNCLKDDALNAVLSILLLSSVVSKVISALKLRRRDG